MEIFRPTFSKKINNDRVFESLIYFGIIAVLTMLLGGLALAIASLFI